MGMGTARRVVVAAFLVSFFVGCHRAGGGADAGDASRMAPSSDAVAKHAEEPPIGDTAPLVELRGTAVFLDGTQAGDVSDVDSSKRRKRISELFDPLRAKRDVAIEAKRPAPSSATFRIPATASGLVVMSVVETTAFAGYSSGSFEVRRPDGTAGRLVMDLIVPPPPMWERLDEQSRPERTLHVRVVSDKVTLEWRDSPHAVSSTQEIKLEELEGAVQASWREKGVSRSGRYRDPARLHFSNEATFGTMIQVADAVAAAARAPGDPAFEIGLTFAP